MNTPKTHDNRQVQTFLDGFCTAYELCSEYPAMDDIFSGVLALRSESNTATRSLSRRVLFTILQQCPVIDAASVDKVTGDRYAESTVKAYAAVARVASKAMRNVIEKEALPSDIASSRRELDAPYLADLELRIQNTNLYKRWALEVLEPEMSLES